MENLLGSQGRTGRSSMASCVLGVLLVFAGIAAGADVQSHFTRIASDARRSVNVDSSQRFSKLKMVTDKGFISSAPDSVDWRAQGAVTPVKNLGNCTGGSWAFATAAAVEAANKIATGQLLGLSAQQLIDCEKEYGNQGCTNGFPQYAFDYLTADATNGLFDEAAYPFAGKTETCKTKVQGYVVPIDGADNRYTSTPSDDSDIVEMVAKQPVTAVIDGSSDAVKNYKGGIFTGPCLNDYTSKPLSVLIVGYGTEGGKKYWILKNSWGTGWGENGYMKLERGNSALSNGRCGINNFVWYPLKKNSVPSVPVPQTGPVGWWKLDEKSGTKAMDSSLTGAQCVVSGATWNTNGGLSFSGSGVVSCGNKASLCGKTPFSIAVWIQVPSSTNTKGVIVQQRGASNWTGTWTTDGYNGEYQLYVESDGKPTLWVYGNGDNQFRFAAGQSIKDNNWHHIVAIRDGTQGSLYVDGKLSGSATGPIKDLVSNIPVHIGSDYRDYVDYFKGSIMGVRVYNRAISSDEVKQLSSSRQFN